MWLFPILLLATTYCYQSSAKTLPLSQRADEEDPYRLPKTVLPESYAVTIVVEEDFAPKGVFTGSVSINLKAVENVEGITLHARFLAINEEKVELTCGNATNLFESLSNETNYHKIFVKAKNSIPAGTSCTLKFEDFAGELQDDMNGFYRSWYENEKGEIEWLGTTQFQPVHARRAFPCFDEPEFKATFTLTIHHPESYTAISNTPLSSNLTSSTGLVIDVFEPTPVMSTYLVAFIVSKFEYIETWENYKIFARNESLDTAEFISYVTPYFVQNLEKFTDIEYSSGGISKIDQVALPDFDAGAMENWGLITYRERALLWDPEHSSNTYKQNIAMTVAHELTHMWFGDLVTCEWWSYTWLNEGFARYFQYMTPGEVDEIDKWELENQFVTLVVQAVFTSDSVIGATPLTSPASTPSDITTKFNTISYSKGASVIRMMEHFMGSENFTSGLRTYLKAHRHETTTPDDLFEALTLYASNLPEGRSFKDVLTLWTEQSGYPVIQVSLSGADAVITQKQFLYDPSSSSNTMWDIPLTYTTSHGSNFEDLYSPTWFSAIKSSVTIPNILHGGSGWVVFNLQEIGYYRVNYDDVLWTEIEEALKSEDFGGIHVLNRAQIVDDVLNLARARIVTYTRALDVISYLEHEEEYYPWYSALTALSYVKRRIGNDATLKELFDTFVSSILTDVLDTVAFNDANTDHIFTLKRHLLLTWACQLNAGDCVENSQKIFDSYKNDGVSVDPNLRSVVYCNALRYAETPDNFYFLLNKYSETKLSTEQVTILATLGCTKNASLLTEYMEKTLIPTNSSKIRVQDYSTLFTSVLDSNYEGLSVLLEFLKNNYQELPNYYPGWASLFSSLAERFTTSGEVEELRTFYDENKEALSDVASTIESAISTAEANIEWTTSVRSELTNRLRGSASSVAINTLLLFVCAFFAQRFIN